MEALRTLATIRNNREISSSGWGATWNATILVLERLSAPNKTAAQVGEKAGWLRSRGARREGALRAPPVSPTVVNASGGFLGQPNDNALGAADVGEPIRVLVLHHFAD